jgi:AcrR family transcriptional regulator
MLALVALRDEQRELTRRKVLGAVLDLVAEGSLDDLSVPAVARRSGVSLATIYRYFPTKDALIDAAASEPERIALQAEPATDHAEYLRSMWHEFSKNLPLLRHQVTSTAGREMRKARLDRSRKLLAQTVRRAGIDPKSAEGKRLISLLLLVSGSLALVELHDRQGLDVDAAVDASLWAANALMEATKQ